MKHLFLCCATLLLFSCNDQLHIKQDYDFSLSCWHLQSEIENGESVEIRLTLDRENDFKGATYRIGYVQLEGSGMLYDTNNMVFENREFYPLEDLYSINFGNPLKQVFTLYYKSLSDKKSDFQIIITDNFSQQRELKISFQNTSAP